jgi:hypothetical protein
MHLPDERRPIPESIRSEHPRWAAHRAAQRQPGRSRRREPRRPGRGAPSLPRCPPGVVVIEWDEVPEGAAHRGRMPHAAGPARARAAGAWPAGARGAVSRPGAPSSCESPTAPSPHPSRCHRRPPRQARPRVTRLADLPQALLRPALAVRIARQALTSPGPLTTRTGPRPPASRRWVQPGPRSHHGHAPAAPSDKAATDADGGGPGDDARTGSRNSPVPPLDRSPGR